jgi:adenylate cyclase
VRDVISAHSLPRITMKGISREVIPYSVDGMMDISSEKGSVVVERMPGLEFYLDPSIIRSTDAERIRSMLLSALSSLDNRQVKPAS